MNLPNSKAILQERLQAGGLNWRWPVIIVFARLIFAVLAQTLVAGIFMLKGHLTPFQAAAPWWPVYGTLIDIGCLILLARLAKREGIRLFDLINFKRLRFGRDLLYTVLLFFLFMTLAIGGQIIFGSLIYGEAQVPIPFSPLPLWGALYAILVWPIIWAAAEEMTYQGYALPRLEVLSGRAWAAMVIVIIGWSIQHSALPMILDWQWTIYRFGSNLPLVILMIIYLRTRRLLPFIIIHWAANFLAALTAVFLPMLKL